MSTIAINNSDWLMRLLAPQSREVKLDLISRLSASLIKKTRKSHNDMSFFDQLTNAWDDGTSAEEEIACIKEARTSGVTMVSDNIKHLERLPGIQIENWTNKTK